MVEADRKVSEVCNEDLFLVGSHTRRKIPQRTQSFKNTSILRRGGKYEIGIIAPNINIKKPYKHMNSISSI